MLLLVLKSKLLELRGHKVVRVMLHSFYLHLLSSFQSFLRFKVCYPISHRCFFLLKNFYLVRFIFYPEQFTQLCSLCLASSMIIYIGLDEQITNSLPEFSMFSQLHDNIQDWMNRSRLVYRSSPCLASSMIIYRIGSTDPEQFT